MAEIELKPCPFCGCTDIRLIDVFGGGGMVRCANCEAEMHSLDIDMAFKKWNRRVQNDEL